MPHIVLLVFAFVRDQRKLACCGLSGARAFEAQLVGVEIIRLERFLQYGANLKQALSFGQFISRAPHCEIVADDAFLIYGSLRHGPSSSNS